jgi:hypothetical protein
MMDPLTHLIISLAAGYLISMNLGMRLGRFTIPILATASILIDVDHLILPLGVSGTLVLHNFLAVVALAILMRWAFGFEHALLFGCMLVGHLILDMNTGVYGIPFLYPLAGWEIMIPRWAEVFLFNDPRYTLISRTGLGLAAYSIFLYVVLTFVKRNPSR